MLAPAARPASPNTPSMELPASLAAALAQKLEDGTLDLPVLADAAQRVMQMALDESVDPSVLAETIKRDGAMASHLLRVANSSLYRGRAAIVSLQQAVSRLGMRKVREIALAIVCESRVFRVRGYDSEVRACFRHSLGAAFFAQEIARVKRASVEEAFLAGLLHDIGRPLLLQAIVALGDRLSHTLLDGGTDKSQRRLEADLGDSPEVLALNLYPEEVQTILGTVSRIKAAVEVT